MVEVTVKPQGSVPSDDEMKARMALSPLTNPEREAAVIKLYQEAGAAAQVVSQSGHLRTAVLVQRHVERSLDASLLVEIRRTGTDQDDR